ncbi:hypothetical protein FQR65_LT08628 [Abscondita terminalis]|nr:hypothetical protein FQR65_LT08628 [Abscondita terminalis]
MMSKTGIEPIQYVYTKDNNYLTNEQRDFYEENGYLIVRNLVDSELIDECKRKKFKRKKIIDRFKCGNEENDNKYWLENNKKMCRLYGEKWENIEDLREECVELREEEREAENVENRIFYGVLDVEKYSPIYLPMKKGDTIFFHTLLLHGSGPNVTQGYRKALTCHYVNNNSIFYMDPKNKEKVYDKEMFEKWGYGKTSYEEIWKKKLWLVRGYPGKLQGFENKL